MSVPHWLDVRGRMSRRAYWRFQWAALLVALVSAVGAIVLAMIEAPRLLPLLALTPIPLVLVAGIPASVRRLHDRGLSGWWLAGSTVLWSAWAFALLAQTPPFDPAQPRLAATLAAGVIPLGFSVWLYIQYHLDRSPRVDRYGRPG